MDSANQPHNQQRQQQPHRRQEIAFDPLPAFPSSFQETRVPSSNLCASAGNAKCATTVQRVKSPVLPVVPLQSMGLYSESYQQVAHKRKCHKARVHEHAHAPVRSRSCWGSMLQVPRLHVPILLQLILVLTSFVTNHAAVDDRDMTQWSVGEFQLDLIPTPEPLTNVDNVVAPSIEQVVRSAMQHQFAESFLYMYVASLGHVQEQLATGRQGQQETVTYLHYNGGVVAFDRPPPPAIDINAIVKASIEANLTKELATHGEPWSWIQSVSFNSLQQDNDIVAGPPAPGSVPTTTSTTTPPSVAPSSTSSSNPPPPTGGGASAIEGGEGANTNNTSQSESKTTAPQIVASGFGIAFVMIGVTLFVKATRNRRTHVRQVALSLEEADSEGSVDGDGPGDRKDPSSQGLDVPSTDARQPTSTKSRGSRSRAARPRGIGGGGGSAAYVFEDATDDEDRSEMAQYSTGEWIESTSVAQSVTSSDFTLTTVDDATYSALADNSIGRSDPSPRTSSSNHPDTSSRVAVMGFASSETFERDRLVTLHKDMLQSEWGTPLANHGHITYATNNGNIIRPTTGPASMSFEEAYQGDGDEPREEVYILPPPPSNTSHSRRKNDLKD